MKVSDSISALFAGAALASAQHSETVKVDRNLIFASVNGKSNYR